MSLLKEITRYIGTAKLLLVLLLAFMAAMIECYFRYNIAEVLKKAGSDSFGNALLSSLFLCFFYMILSFTVKRLSVHYSIQYNWNKQAEVERSVLEADYDCLNTIDSGSIINHIQVDIRNVVRCFTRLIDNFLPTTFSLVITLVFLFRIQWLLGIVGTIFSVLPFIYMRYLSKHAGTLYHDYYHQLDEVASSENSSLLHLDSVKMLLLETKLIADHQCKMNQLNQSNKRTVVRETVLSMPTILFSFITMIILASLSAILILQGKMTIAHFLTVVLFVDNIVDPGMMFDGTIMAYRKADSALKRIKKTESVLKNKAEEREKASDISSVEKISISDVIVDYHKEKKNLVHINSCTFIKGKINVIKGANGVGKSTLVALLTGTLSGYKGRILFENQQESVNLKDIKKNRLAQLISVCPQESILFPVNIQENLVGQDVKPSIQQKEQIGEYLNRLGLLQEINQLPEGFGTVLYDNGSPLSGGQKKRLSIVKALIKEETKILMFDEPVNAFEGDTADEFWRILEENRTNKLIIVITHGQIPEFVTSKEILLGA